MRNRMIVIEGPQGTGKTTLANYLRENIASSNLYRLSGQKDKTSEGKKISRKMYNTLLKYLKNMEDIPMDLIFDRTFFTEEVYARLGFKEYRFTDVYQRLLEKFNELNFDIYYISLYLKDTDLFIKRLARDSHHNYQSFSKENSVRQQNEYKNIVKELKECRNVKTFEVAMDDFDEAYKKINQILNIN